MAIFSKQIGARQSRSDPAMFYWSQQKQESIIEREKRQSWKEFKSSAQPLGISEGIAKGQVRVCCAAHVDAIVLFGKIIFRYGLQKTFSEDLKRKISAKTTVSS